MSKTHIAYIDYKVTIWNRIHVREDLSKEQFAALKAVIDKYETEPWEIRAYLIEQGLIPEDVEVEELLETEEALSIHENDGEDTVEIFNGKDEMIWNNTQSV